VVYALTTHPGHHASPLHYGGYCFVNNVCCAAHELTRAGKRVGIIDVDYHAGDGTWRCFQRLQHALCVDFVSLHSAADYPHVFLHQNAIELSGGVDWSTYEPCLQSAIDRVLSRHVDVLALSLGLDTVAEDPEPAVDAAFRLTPKDFARMGEMFRDTGVQLLVFQEGGYALDVVPDCVHQFLAAARPMPSEPPSR